MEDEMKRYNNMRGSQPQSTAQQQPPQRPNSDIALFDFLGTEDESTHSWRPEYSNIDKSNEASEPLSNRS